MNLKKLIFPIMLILIILTGLAMMFYPWFSAWYTDHTRSEILTEYQERVHTADTTTIEDTWDAAVEFNNLLFTGQIDPLDAVGNGYYDQLDLLGNGVIGYIKIDKINVSIPIYHGTSDESLSKGAGHMPQTSLPVGGINTHSVITAHNGMASSPMFTDLELLEPGDTFQLEILGEILTYEVQSEDDINVVLPSVIDGIQIRRGEDLCTLITCTPFGVNSHRLVVTGHRIETPEASTVAVSDQDTIQEDDEPESIWQTQYRLSLGIGLGFAAISLIFILLLLFCKRKKGKYETEKNR